MKIAKDNVMQKAYVYQFGISVPASLADELYPPAHACADIFLPGEASLSFKSSQFEGRFA